MHFLEKDSNDEGSHHLFWNFSFSFHKKKHHHNLLLEIRFPKRSGWWPRWIEKVVCRGAGCVIVTIKVCRKLGIVAYHDVFPRELGRIVWTFKRSLLGIPNLKLYIETSSVKSDSSVGKNMLETKCFLRNKFWWLRLIWGRKHLKITKRVHETD